MGVQVHVYTCTRNMLLMYNYINLHNYKCTCMKSVRESRVSYSVMGYLRDPGANRPTATSSPQSDRPGALCGGEGPGRERDMGYVVWARGNRVRENG